VNNRPGRFDVVMEIGCPDQMLRREFFAHRLPLVDPGFLDQLSHATDGLSFAHLQEVLRASALKAIHEGRSDRSATDLLAAVDGVRNANESAERGFPARLDIPFGLSLRRPAR
jgi:ATP-dependent 26S proteasome regulatory subunit